MTRAKPRTHAPAEIALGGRELRALHKGIGDHITAQGDGRR
jgi:hypothetical protein